jgi:uncharacterized protein YuzE
MYIKLSARPKHRTINVLCRDTVYVDYAEDGEIVGVEIAKPIIASDNRDDLVKDLIELGKVNDFMVVGTKGLSVQSGDTLPQNKE